MARPVVPQGELGFDEIHLFLAVCECGSLAEAARRLGMSPSVASRRIAALEVRFGTRLIVRTTRRLSLTEAGRRLRAWAGTAAEGYLEIREELAAAQDALRGTIRFACNDFAAEHILVPIFADFCALHPEIRIHVTTSFDPVHLPDTAYDLALHVGCRPDADVVSARIRTFRRALLASPDYLRRNGAPESLADLPRHRALVHPTVEGRLWHFLDGDEVRAVEVAPYVSCDSFAFMRAAAIRGMGIVRISSTQVRENVRDGSLVELLAEHVCVHADGSLPAAWIVFPHRSILRRTRVLADTLSSRLQRGSPRELAVLLGR